MNLHKRHSGSTPKRAVFLDRDGTLLEEDGYLNRPEDIRYYNQAFDAVKRINASGSLAVVITNQSAIARGLLSEEDLSNLHHILAAGFDRQGARIDAIYYCPHHPEAGDEPYRGTCQCRKPNPGMLLSAAQDLDLDLTSSHIIGDKLLDVEAGHRAGCTSVLVRTGHGEESWRSVRTGESVETLEHPDFVADDVLQAVNWILGGSE